ncbi:MAG: peroxiredoxin-like family protein [Dehalococcoidia bacterium]
MRDYVPRIHAAGAELIILGNGTPEQAKWFVEDYHVETPVFTDPKLASHAIVGARRMAFPDPRTVMAGVSAFARGFRQTGVKGSATQLGGVFVITADGRMPYRYLSRFAGDHPDPEAALAVLEREAEARSTQ